jgi:hypothetical protein
LRTLVQEGVISVRKSATIIPEQRRRHRRIAEARMVLHAWRPSFGNVTPRRFKPIVVTLLGCISGGRRGVNSYRMGMRTSGQTQGKQ